MPKLTQSDEAKGIVGVPYPFCAGAVCAHRFQLAVPTDMAVGDILELGVLPKGCVPVDLIVEADDIDSGTAAITFDIGMMSGDAGDNDASRTVGAEFFSGTTLGQAAGIVRPTLKTAQRIAVADSDRSIGVKMTHVPGTAAAGVVGLTLLYATP